MSKLMSWLAASPPSASGSTCRGLLNMEECSQRPDCFPYWDGYMLTCRPAEVVNCSMDPARDGKKLLLFASLGLVNNAMKRAMRELVLKLPDMSWSTPEIGSLIKGSSLANDDCVRDTTKAELSWRGLREPELYNGLTAVVLWDACYLKESFWNAAHPDFGRFSNYIKMSQTVSGPFRRVAVRTLPRAARGDAANMGSWDGLESGYCEDFTPWLTEELGFEPERVHRISLFDRLASSNLTSLVFEVQKLTDDQPDEERVRVVQAELLRVRAAIDEELLDPRSEASRLMTLLEGADVIALNGGNPDFLKFVLMELAAPFTVAWTRRVEAGRAIFLGRSAGAMVGGLDISLTYEPNPLLLEYLAPGVGGLHRGLGLAGACTIRPHYSDHWDVVVALARQMQWQHGYSEVSVVRVPNEEALQCVGTVCKMVGATSRQAETPLSKRQLRRLMRGFGDQHEQQRATAEFGDIHEMQQALQQCRRGLSDFD